MKTLVLNELEAHFLLVILTQHAECLTRRMRWRLGFWSGKTSNAHNVLYVEQLELVTGLIKRLQTEFKLNEP